MSDAVHVSEDEVFMFSEESENDEFFEDIDGMNDVGSSKGKGTDVTDEVFDIWARKDVYDGGETSKPGFLPFTHDYLSPGDTPYWTPQVPDELIPKIGMVFGTYNDAVRMYKAYAFEAGFDVRNGTTKKKTTGEITVRYMLCNRQGKPNVGEVDTTDVQHKKFEKGRDMFRTECNAKVVLHLVSCTQKFVVHDFVERHNHPLISKDNVTPPNQMAETFVGGTSCQYHNHNNHAT